MADQYDYDYDQSDQGQYAYDDPANDSYNESYYDANNYAASDYYSAEPNTDEYSNVPVSHSDPSNHKFFEDVNYMDSTGKDFIANMTSNPLAQVGFSYAENFLQQQAENQNFPMMLSTLKYYFNVNTPYVLKKLQLIIFPFRHKSWTRKFFRDESIGIEAYLPPKEDINAPDLYIPLMSFVTYVLLYGFLLGVSNRFTPELLATVSSRTIAILILELAVIKAAFFILPNALEVKIYDLIAYIGYVFVGVNVSLLSGYLFGNTVLFGTAIILGLSMSTFMVKTLRLVFPTGYDMGVQQSTSLRNYFLLVVAVIQIVISFYLST
eukprot:TRINITY_DN8574_c0_g1_i1.p1 TRINITY_DN8574_c0_g1~~TRINITY_DN8574_c0_g1_i1.p1  ORF type:complete len:329 (-),score=109.11 TRINITY_DN8574_c0_g1_i1:104-1069(-)